MSCDGFLERLYGLPHGDVAGSDRAAAFRHLEECGDCRGLFAALVAAGQAPEDPELSEAILARTSGAGCESAQSRLPARLDGELDAVEAKLVTEHIRCCVACGALARALALAQEELPHLAKIDPGPRFVEGVLARTSRRYKRESLADPIVAFVSRLLLRRRIAWEGAFVATCFLVAPVAAPGSPFADLPGQALGLMREAPSEPRAALDRLRDTMNDPESPVGRGAGAVWASTGAAIVRGSTTAWSGLARSSTGAWEAIRDSFGTFPDSAASGQTSGANESKPEPAAKDQETRK